MNGENKPIGPAPHSSESGVGPAPLPDNRPFTPPGPSGPTPPPPVPPTGTSGPAGGIPSGPPPPPPPQIDIRTMASDADSLKRSGGLGTEPKTFSPADLAKEPVFASEIVSPAGAGAAKAGVSGKKVGLVAGAAAILFLAALAGYFFVWPLFSGSEEEQVVTETTPPPVLPTETPAPPAPTSQSLFTKPAASTKEVSLSTLTLAELSSALKTKSGEAAATGTVKEVIVKVNGTSATSSALLNVLVPGTGLESMLEPLVTSFIYYDAKGAWPGYIFKLKSGTNPAAAQTSTVKIEQSVNLAALYLTSPGAPKGGWKDGSVDSAKTRYLAYSAAGASLNYGWVNNYLVISTSYDGFKKALDLIK